MLQVQTRSLLAMSLAGLALTSTGCAKDPSKDAPAAKVAEPAAEANKEAPKEAAKEEPKAAEAAKAGAVAPAPAAAAPAAAAPSTAPFAAPNGSVRLMGSVNFVGSKVTGRHEGHFKEFSGYFVPKDGKAEGAALGFEVKTASLEEIVKERNEWTEKLETHLKSPDFFDVEKFPTASFISSEIAAGGDAAVAGTTHTIKGRLTLRGVTKDVAFPVTIALTGKDISAKAEFSINRKDFGIMYTGKADDLIRDGVVLVINVTATLP